jgi:hypothetical protein
MLNECPCERIGKWSICDENCHIVMSIESVSFLRLCQHTWIMGKQQRRGAVGENQQWQREIVYIENDCFEKSQNYCNTGERTAKLNIHLEEPVSTKQSNIHGRAAIAKPLTTESNAQMPKRWCHVTTIKPGHQTTGNAPVIWSDESSYTLFPTSGRVYVWWTSEEGKNSEGLVPTMKHGGVSVMVCATI